MPLGGAVIRIEHIVTNATQELATDASGHAVFEKLPTGAYEIAEVSAPEGYVLDPLAPAVNVLPHSKGGNLCHLCQ